MKGNFGHWAAIWQHWAIFCMFYGKILPNKFKLCLFFWQFWAQFPILFKMYLDPFGSIVQNFGKFWALGSIGQRFVSIGQLFASFRQNIAQN